MAHSMTLPTDFTKALFTFYVQFSLTAQMLIKQSSSVELRETNLMSLALLFHYSMFNMFQMLIHPSSGSCDLFVELFHGLY